MQKLLVNLWCEEEGVLSFEWTVLVTLLSIGVVAGMGAARDGIVDELGDTAESMQAVDGSYRISFPLTFTIDEDGAGVAFTARTIAQTSDSQFIDSKVFTDCDRFSGQFQNQVLSDDFDGGG